MCTVVKLNYVGINTCSNELYHHGIRGQRWGVRRFETSSGHLTAAGKKRYDGDKVTKKEQNDANNTKTKKGLSDGQKKALKIAAGVAVTAAAAYGAKKLMDNVNIRNKKYAELLSNDARDLYDSNNRYKAKKFVENVRNSAAKDMKLTNYMLEGHANNAMNAKRISKDIAKQVYEDNTTNAGVVKKIKNAYNYGKYGKQDQWQNAAVAIANAKEHNSRIKFADKLLDHNINSLSNIKVSDIDNSYHNGGKINYKKVFDILND